MACFSHLPPHQLFPLLRQVLVKKFPVVLNKNMCYHYHGSHLFVLNGPGHYDEPPFD